MKYITASNILHNKNDISINIFSEKGIIKSYATVYGIMYGSSWL
jgi:hypothetical protein